MLSRSDASRYLTLGTADQAGTPWVAPVFYAHADHRDPRERGRPCATHGRAYDHRVRVS